MALEKGGYSDKLGNRYEGRWVVLQMVHVVGGLQRSVTVESVGDDERGVDLWVESNRGDKEAQQCKGALGNKSQWKISDLCSKGILADLQFQLERNCRNRFTLVSSVPATTLSDLCRRAADSTGVATDFYEHQVKTSKPLLKEFQFFCRCLKLDPQSPLDVEEAYRLLERSGFHLFTDDSEGRKDLEFRTQVYFDGDPLSAIAVLADFAETHLRKTLTADDIVRHLQNHGFPPKHLARDSRVVSAARELRNMFSSTFDGQMAGGNLVSRSQATSILGKLKDPNSPRLIVVHGSASYGKSCVLLELTQLLEAEGIPYIPFRLDRQTPQGAPKQFGIEWGLADSPPVCLAHLVGEKQGVLILDQIDAMRWTSGHASDPWLTCQEMIKQALGIGSLRIVVACRTFDLENDPQFKSWSNSQKLERVEVGDLDEATANRLVGNEWEQLTPRQRSLLKCAGNLAMWLEIRASSGKATHFVSQADLLRKFWDNRYQELERRGVPSEDSHRLLQRLIDFFNQHGDRDAPFSLVQPFSSAAKELQSLHVIRVQQNKVSFCHQSYFDYLLAQNVVDGIRSQKKTVFDWLGASRDQSLFRREQLRLLLCLIRDEDPSWYIEVLKAILASKKVRFHLKHLCLQVLGQVDVPSTEEVAFVLALLNQEHWSDHVSGQVLWKHSVWIAHPRIQSELARRLATDNEASIRHALWLLQTVDETCGDRVAELIAPYEGESKYNWQDLIDRMFWRAPENDSDLLFEMRLRRVGQNRTFEYVDWKKLAAAKPDRCLPLIAARLRGLILAAEHPKTEGESGSPSHRTSLFEVTSTEEMDALERLAAENSEYVWESIVPQLNRLLGSDHSAVSCTEHKCIRLEGTAMNLVGAIAAVALIVVVLIDAFEVVILSRRVRHDYRLARLFYRSAWVLWRAAAMALPAGRWRDGFLSVFGPLSLFALTDCVRWAADWRLLVRMPASLNVSVQPPPVRDRTLSRSTAEVQVGSEALFRLAPNRQRRPERPVQQCEADDECRRPQDQQPARASSNEIVVSRREKG